VPGSGDREKPHQFSEFLAVVIANVVIAPDGSRTAVPPGPPMSSLFISIGVTATEGRVTPSSQVSKTKSLAVGGGLTYRSDGSIDSAALGAEVGEADSLDSGMKHAPAFQSGHSAGSLFQFAMKCQDVQCSTLGAVIIKHEAPTM
jgi:hypothetical protein